MNNAQINVSNIDTFAVMETQNGARAFERWLTSTSNGLIRRTIERIESAPQYMQKKFWVAHCYKAACNEIALREKYGVVTL
jgi:hypothetical protein